MNRKIIKGLALLGAAIGMSMAMIGCSGCSGRKVENTYQATTDSLDGYIVKIYDDIIIGKPEFIFENATENRAKLKYTVKYNDDILYETNYLEPGNSTAWKPEGLKNGKTYGCDVIVDAIEVNTGKELNKASIRQLIHIDENYPRTSSGSAYKYYAKIPYENKIMVGVDGQKVVRYDAALKENPIHPVEKDKDKIKIYCQDDLTLTDGHKMETFDLLMVQDNSYRSGYMVSCQKAFGDFTDAAADTKMTFHYDIYAKDSNVTWKAD